MKLRRSTLLPLILLIYLGVMAVIGWKSVKTGETSLTTYWLTIVVTLSLIITLHFFLKKREKLRDERLKDIENISKEKNNNT